MYSIILDRLVSSLDNLEQAVERARVNLIKKKLNIPEVFERFNSYREICARQRSYAESVRECLKTGRHQEVMRLVNLINGLSVMIAEDVKEVLASIDGNDCSMIVECCN